MRLVVINHVRGFDHSRRAGLLFSRVQVAVEAREVAAGNLQPQFVPCEKHIARRPQIHRNVIRLTRVRQFRLLLRIPVTQPRIPLVRFCAKPFGQTSTSIPVKSVSTAELLTNKSSETGPVTSVSFANAGVVNTSTSLRASTGLWSSGPIPVGSAPQHSGPPIVGTASVGS